MKMGRLILFVVCCMTGITGCFSKSSGDQDGLLFMLAALPGMGTVWNVTTLAGPAPGTIASGDIEIGRAHV